MMSQALISRIQHMLSANQKRDSKFNVYYSGLTGKTRKLTLTDCSVIYLGGHYNCYNDEATITGRQIIQKEHVIQQVIELKPHCT